MTMLFRLTQPHLCSHNAQLFSNQINGYIVQ